MASREQGDAALSAQREPQVCPSCGTLNTPSAERCECGYALSENAVTDFGDRRPANDRAWATGLVAGFLFGIVGWIVVLLTAKRRETKTGATVGMVINLLIIAVLAGHYG